MDVMVIKYNNIEIENEVKLKEFKSMIRHKNIIYFFFANSKCLYIGETNTSLYERCYTHTPKESEQQWFKDSNKIVMIELDNSINKIARQAIEGVFILAYKPKYNKNG